MHGCSCLAISVRTLTTGSQATILRGELAPGLEVRGPALCALGEATLFVPPDWSGTVDEQGTCVLQDGA